MSFVDNILVFLTDKNRRLSSRATIFIISVLTLLFIDNVIGFSKYYNQSRKLEQLKTVSELLDKPNLSSDTKSKLREIEKETFIYKNILDYSVEFVGNIISDFKFSSPDEVKVGRNNFWFLISSSLLYLLGLIAAPILLLLGERNSILEGIGQFIMMSIIFTFSSWFHYWLFGKIIPDKLFGSWGWNYVVNFLLQIILVVSYIKIQNYSNKKANYFSNN